MKKKLGFLVIILVFFIGCSEDNESANNESANNESIIYQEENIRITLIDINDGRCPINVNCTWQGNAEVKMRISKDNETMEFTLNTAGYINESFNFPTKKLIFGLNIELLDLEPYPEVGMDYTLEDYTVSIGVN